MSTDNPATAYDAVLADLKAKRDQIDAAIAALTALAGVTSTTSGTNVSMPGKATIRPDEFFGMTIVEASKKYLGMMTRPQSGQTITDSLKAGGYLFQSEAPVQTVNSILNRAYNEGGDIVRVGKGMFGLAKWYPNRPRVRRTAEEQVDETSETTETAETTPTAKGESNPDQTAT